jgi:DNA primase
VELKIRGKQHHGYCPLPNHKGKRNSVSFSANLERGIFQCFGCGAKGNLLEFAALMENIDPANGTELHRVAIKLQQRFCLTAPQREQSPMQKKVEPVKDAPVVVNAPLDFELKGLDYTHPYLRNRRFSWETIEYFGLGVASRGLFKGRLAIPLHDHESKLVGYAGRAIDDNTINADNPKYRFPSKRERDGIIHEFRKTAFLYNGYRIEAPVNDLIVVEGFPSVWWLRQNGQPSVVATMGADCSERQADLIVSLVKPDGRVWLMPDGDEAGSRFAESLLRRVSPHRFTRWVKLNQNSQPTDLSVEQLKTYFIR